jgi:hypothetical protein
VKIPASQTLSQAILRARSYDIGTASCEAFCRNTARIVSWLTPKSAASARRLLVPARARMERSCSGLSLRARAQYRVRAETSRGGCRRCGHRTPHADPARRSGKGMRTDPIVIEEAEPIPVASAISTWTLNQGCDLAHGASGTIGQARQSGNLQFAAIPTVSSAVNRSTIESPWSGHRAPERACH